MNDDSHWTVMCITFCKDQVLMMKRTQEPFAWAPPAGHLKVGETYEAGIKREVFEETGLMCDVIMPVDVWQGIHRQKHVTNLTFVCEVMSKDVVLSKEHSAYQWIDLEHIRAFQGETHLDLSAWPFYIEMAKRFKEEYKVP